MVELTLPYPISANRYWRSFVPRGHSRAIVTLSDEAKSYKAEVGWIAKQRLPQPLLGRVAVDIRLYPKRPQDWARRAAKNPLTWDDDVMCIDIDNARKVLYDALKGVAFSDDDRIFRDSAQRMEPDGAARVVVTITQLALPAHPQRDLIGEAA